MDRLLRLPEVAALLQIPEGTLRHWRYAGSGPKCARIGRNLVYRLSDVEYWVAEQFGDPLPDTGAGQGRTRDSGVA